MSVAETAGPVPVETKPTSSLYMIALLGIVSTVCGLVIVLAYEATMPAIKRNLAQITREAVREILPEAENLVIYGVAPSGDFTKLSDLDTNLPTVFVGFKENGELAGVVCEAAGRGYADIIKVLYAYSPERERIIGYKVLESKETPGLGDKIVTDSEFLANFADLDVSLDVDKKRLEHPITTVKHGTKTQGWQIDGISGATVSSKAVAELLNAGANEMIPLVVGHLDQLRKGA